MKKLLLLLVLVSGFATAQWESVDIVDDFGDTLYTAYNQSAVGVFSNSATTNSTLRVNITEFKDLYRFTFYEYGSSPTSFHYSDYSVKKVITMKDPAGNRISGTVSFRSGSEGIYIYKANKLGKAIMKNTGEFTFVTTDQHEYSTPSKYKFKFKGGSHGNRN